MIPRFGRKPRVVFEALEPRTFLSADLAPLAAADTGLEAAIVRSLEPDVESIVIQMQPVGADTSAGISVDGSLAVGESATPPAPRRELVFVDDRLIKDGEVLAGLWGTSDASTRRTLVVLDSGGDGVAQISAALAHEQAPVDALHIITHATSNGVQVGGNWLDSDNLASYGAELARWQAELTDQADILFYGCDLARDAAGRQFLREIGTMTGADVAASTNLTGHVTFGGDWILEFRTGALDAAIAVPESTLRGWIGTLAVNAAPVLSGANALVGIVEDVIGDNGTLVAALIGTHVSDADAGALRGVAVTAADNTNGTWQFSINGGGAWTDFGNPSTAAARLLGADTNTLVRFVPNAHFSGVVAGGLSFRAWDQSSGVAGALADTTINGGSSAFSSAIAAAGITVSAVNDAPAGTNATLTINEDAGYTFSAADFGFSDTNDSPANALSAVRIATLPGAGVLKNSGIAVSAGQSVSVADINAGRLVFTPGANGNGVGYAAFTFQVQDDGGTANGGIDLDPTSNTLTFNVTAVNDQPVNTVPYGQLTALNTALAFSTANDNRIAVADSDAGGASVELTLAVTNGTLTLGGTAGLSFSVGNGTNDTTMTFTGALASVNAALDGLTFSPNLLFSGTATLSITSSDLGNTGSGGALSDTDTVDITVQALTLLLIANESHATAESTVLNAASVLANDLDPLLGTMSISAVNGNAAAVGNTITLPSGALLSMNTDGTFAYDPNGVFETLGQGAIATDSFIYAISSTSGQSGSGKVTITINGANDAPVLSGANALVGIVEDVIGDNGTLVAALIGTHVSDADAGALRGVAVTAADNTNGTWQFSINGGGAWTDFGNPSTAAARLLGADTNTLVRFVPNAHFSGVVAGGLSFRAWDQSSGVAGALADTTINGGSSAFSSAIAAAGITVSAVNDAPAGTNATLTINEDAGYTFSAADFGFSDTNDSPANALSAVRIATLPGAGVLKNSGIAVSAGQSVSVADINAGRLVFTPGANGNGVGYAAFTFQVQDDGGTANGGIDLDPTSNTLTFNVTPVSDAPTGTNATLTINEDAGYTFSAADFGFSDTNDSPANALSAVRIATLPGAGVLKNSGIAVSAGQSVSVADIDAGRLVFTPGANGNGVGYAAFTFQVQDDGGTANGGIDLDPTPNTLTFNVTPVSDAPTGTNATLTINEDAGYTFSAADFGFSDTNDSPANALSAVRIATLPGAGVLKNSGIAVSAGQSVSVVDINAGRLAFTPGANGNGVGYAAFTFQVQDNGGTGNGGIDLDPSPNTITFDVTPVNDAPAGTNATLTINEDAAYAFSAADFGFADATDSPTNVLSAVRVSALPGTGVLKNNGIAVSAGQSVSVADINAGRLVFTPGANGNGVGYAAFTFQVQDDGGTANGGIDLDPGTRTLTFDVNAVNDPPTYAILSGAVALTREDVETEIRFTAIAAQSDAADVDGAIAAFVVKAVASGTLRIGTSASTATAWSAGSNDVIDAARHGFWAPAPNAHGSVNAFALKARDDGGAESAVLVTAMVSIDPVADTPSVTGAATNEDMQTTAGLVITPSSVDGAEVTHFKITAIGAGRLYHADGVSAIADGAFITAAEGAAGLKFTPAPDSIASGTFSVQAATAASDTGLGGALTSAIITVTPVNDAPVLDGIGAFPLLVMESDNPRGALVSELIAGHVSDVDRGDRRGIAITVADAAHGDWQYSLDNGASWIDIGSVSESRALLLAADPGNRLRFVPDAAFAGQAALALRAWDVTAGASGTYADASNAGGATQFSVASAIARVLVQSNSSAVPGAVSLPTDSAPVISAAVAALAADAETTTGSVTLAEPSLPSPALSPGRTSIAAAQTEEASTSPVHSTTVVATESAGAAVAPSQVAGSPSAQSVQPGFPAVHVGIPLRAPTSEPLSLSVADADRALLGTDFTPQPTETAAAVASVDLREELDRLRKEAQEVERLEHKVIGASAVLTGSLSAGYVLWLLRGGVLLTSLLSSLPAWRVVDPLLVLAKRGRHEGEDEESLETLVEERHEPERAEGSTSDTERTDDKKSKTDAASKARTS